MQQARMHNSSTSKKIDATASIIRFHGISIYYSDFITLSLMYCANHQEYHCGGSKSVPGHYMTSE